LLTAPAAQNLYNDSAQMVLVLDCGAVRKWDNEDCCLKHDPPHQPNPILIMSDSVFPSLPSHFLISALAIAFLAVAGGCSSVGEEEPVGPTAPSQPLSFETVEQSHVAPGAVDGSASSTFEDGIQRVIRDQGAFESFWQDLHGENADAEVPAIDFSEEAVVVAMLGERPCDGYEAKIAGINKNKTANSTRVSVLVTEVEPSSNCDAAASSVIPYHIVKMSEPSTDQVSFKMTESSDSLMLVNRTDTAFVALAFHPKTARPLKSNIEVNVREKRTSEEPSFYVAAGDSTALWPCDSLGQYEDYTLHLYRIPGGAEGVVKAPLARSVRLTADHLDAARDQRCRLEINEL
jgi:hypothetical protein